MDIAVMTDSRGFCPGKGRNWVADFVSRNPQHNVTSLTWDLGDQGRIVTLFGHVETIKKMDQFFDLIILQCGSHEYVQFWPTRILKYKVGKYDPDWSEHLTEIENKRFRYRNDGFVQQNLIELKKHARNLLLIGLHVRSYKYEEATLTMNGAYDIDNVDYMNLPAHMHWTHNNCYDTIHYSKAGREHICSYVERYVKRLPHNLVTKITKNCAA